ncbi:MAG: hypothetical protein V2A76_06730 [Planctomycetota bacterium]
MARIKKMWQQLKLVCPGLVFLFLLSACSSIDPQHDDNIADPDDRLELFLRQYEEARQGELREKIYEEENHVLVDTGLLRSRIEGMCFEFPNHVPSYMANAVLSYYDEHDGPKAQSYLDALFRLQPVHPRAAMLRARIASEEGNLPMARTLLDEQIMLTPNHAGLREQRAMVLTLMGEHESALSELDLAERFGAPAWRVAYHRGLVREGLGQQDAAAEQYELCLEANPAWVPAANRLSALR